MRKTQRAVKLETAIAAIRADVDDLGRQFDLEFGRLTAAEQAAFMAGRCPNSRLERICEDWDACDNEIDRLEFELEIISRYVNV